MRENDRAGDPPEERLPDAESMPTLREYWEELQRAKAAQDALGLPDAGSGSGSGGGGYGLGLISADEDSQRRIRAIMRELCERDAAKE